MRKKTLRALKSLKRNYLILFILFTVLTLALIYNSCSSEGSKSVKFSKILNNLRAGFSVTINSGFYATKKKNVTLTFEAPEKNLRGEVVDYEIKVSRNSDCSDGEWEDYKPTKKWNLDDKGYESEKEKKYFIYTKFREKRPENVNYVLRSGATGESDCVHDSILYDTYPPRLKIIGDPPKITGTHPKNARFTFKGTDFGPIAFKCRIDRIDNPETPKRTCDTFQGDKSLWKPCSSEYTDNSLELLKTGDKRFRFFLRGKDAAGNCAILDHEWTIDPTIPNINPDCPGQKLMTSPDSIEVELKAPNATKKRFSLLCSKDKEDNEFKACECKSENPCSNIEISSPTPPNTSTPPTKRSIIKESFIKEPKATNYDKYSLSVKFKDTTSDPVPCTWHVDSEAPKVEPQLLTTGGKKYNQDGMFNFTISDNSDVELDNNNELTGVNVTLKYKIKPKGGSYGENRSRGCNTKTSKLGDCSVSIASLVTPGTDGPNEYTLSVSAKDSSGNESEPKELDFYVMSRQTSSETEHQVSPSSGKVDILFVMNDAHSAKYKYIAESFGASFSGIIDSLSDLDWQIAVTSMERADPNSDYIKSRTGAVDDGFKGIEIFGKLVQLINHETNEFLTDGDNNKYILSAKPTQDCTETPALYCSSETSKLQGIFTRTITKKIGTNIDNHFTFHGCYEYGIQSVNVLLEYYAKGADIGIINLLDGYTKPTDDEINAIKSSFFRENSTFVVILVADQKNCGDNPCYNQSPNSSDNPDVLIEKVKTTLGGDKKFIFYPIIPEPGEGYPYTTGTTTGTTTGKYPTEGRDDYLKLAKATQGRQSKSGENPVIWIDIDHTENRTPRSDTKGCAAGGIYTKDLCAISEDIRNVVQSSIGLSCTNPILDAQHKIKITYLYTTAIDESDLSFTTLSKDERNQLEITDSSGQTHTIKVTEPSQTNRTNRILLESTTEGQSIPSGTYKVEYFCPSNEIIYTTERRLTL